MNAIHMSQYPMNNQYTGEWKEGKRDGFGTYQYASGALYKGEWKDNMKVNDCECLIRISMDMEFTFLKLDKHLLDNS